MTSNLPEEASEIRGHTLTPSSPQPLQYPSPTNIPILEKSMDPVFDEQLGQQGENASAAEPVTAEAEAAAASQAAPGSDPAAGTMPVLEVGDVHQEHQGASSFPGLWGAVTQTNGVDTPDTTQSSLPANAFNAQATSDAAIEQAPIDTSTLEQLPATATDPSQTTQSEPPTTESAPAASTSGATLPGVDIEAILNGLQAHAASNQNVGSVLSPSTAANGATQSPTSAASATLGLPPRPPPREQSTGLPGLPSQDDISQYHKIPSADYRAQTNLPALLTGTGANGMPPPPGASFQQPPSASSTQPPFSALSQGQPSPALDKSMNPEGELPWGPDVQAMYDNFLKEEREYVTQGQWDKFPMGSRLFIGNLPTEKVTKRDIYHIFHKYGRLAQISIKQAYGFVQFLDASSCYKALDTEQGQEMRGRKMHLEISKPQKNTKNQNQRRRSRSPDQGRGNTAGRAPAGVDRYTSAQGSIGSSPRDRDHRRGRDDYRPGQRDRSPEYRNGRDSRDHDRRGRGRSRSPYGRDQYRTRSPGRDADDDLPLPKRNPSAVPDVQIVVIDELDRNFIAYVEQAFQGAGVRSDVLLLSPRLSEPAVIRRQVVEGVLAVCRLTRTSQYSQKVPLQVFDRRGGANNVQFQEYADLDPSVAAQLVLREKQQQPTYGASYGLPPQPPAASYGLPPQLAATPSQDPAALLRSLPPHELQRLLAQAGVQQPQTPPTSQYTQPAQAPSYNALTALLAGQNQPQQPTPLPHQQQPMQSPAPPPSGAPDMNEIMAQLAKYKR